MPKRSWSDLPTSAKAGIVVTAAVQAVITTIALRDLQSRPSGLIRGPAWLWRLASLVQPVGPIAYLVVGRRSV